MRDAQVRKALLKIGLIDESTFGTYLTTPWQAESLLRRVSDLERQLSLLMTHLKLVEGLEKIK